MARRRKQLIWEIETLKYLLKSIERGYFENNANDWEPGEYRMEMVLKKHLHSLIEKLKQIEQMY